MNFRSVHFRLTFWYSLGLFISAAVTFSAFYFVTRQTLLSQTDITITSHAQAIVSTVNYSSNSAMNGLFSQEVVARQFSEMPGMLVVITGGSGKIISSSQTGIDNNPIITDLLEKSTGVIKATFLERTIGTTLLRIGVFPVIKDGTLNDLVLVAHPVDVIYQSLASLSAILLVIYFLFLPLLTFGGYFLSRRALNPISDLSVQLEKITSQNLNEPIKEFKTGDEIQKLAISFNNLLGRLHNAFERERQFISDVTHELKTPLSTLKSSVEIGLSKRRDEDEYCRILKENLVDVERLSNTLNNVLNLAWSEVEQSKDLTKIFNLSQLAEEISDLCVKLAKKKQIKVESKIQQGLSVAGSQDRVFRATLNIIDNAVKYTPSKGQIIISLSKTGKKADLTVSDTGVGIPSEELPKVFDRFYRGSKTEKILGSGLGLAISQGIIKAHQGEITIKSQVGKGTSVIISLPLISA